ncbi:hypothetical protein [Aeoliella sp.]|uniref:hypothetical protein n=1 Tax=Aeoliella sp. TaxID=2795800 RepID=UPI003CCBB635
MQRSFRLRKDYLHSAIWPGGLFGSVFLASLLASVLDRELTLAWLALASFWLIFVLIAGYLLLAYYREQLDIDDRSVRKQGVFSTGELLLDSSANLKWRCWPVSGSVVAQLPLGRIAIDLANYERDERVALIDYLRQAVPAEQQTGWEEFCQRWALPLVEERSPPDKNIVLLTRSRTDKLFLWMLIPTAIVLAVIIYLDGWKWWPSFFALAPLWLMCRLMTPKQGVPDTKLTATPGMRWWLISFSALIVGVFLHAWIKPLGILCWIVSAAAFVQYFRQVSAEDRRRREVFSEQAKTADARWRALRAST